jgi:hypothetical protein
VIVPSSGSRCLSAGALAGGGEHRSCAQYIAEEYPDLVCVDSHIRCERIYPEGSGCTQWFPDGDNSEKENCNPSSSSSGHRSLPRSSSPSDYTVDLQSSFEVDESSVAGPSSVLNTGCAK